MDKGQFLLYQTPDGDSQIEVKLQNDTVWLSLDQMAELFQRNKSTISRHIKNVLEDGELQEEATIANFATVQNEGTRKVERVIAFYNLDMIISVGYRVHSYRGVQFRIWATKVLKEYIVKGFAMNDDLLKRAGGGNYFDELLARIRDIRSSEKVFYRKVLEIYALSIQNTGKNLCAVLSGFTLGCFETIVYSLAGTGTAPLRMVTSVIVHGSCAALSGLFVFSCRHKSPRAFSYIFAVILHGVYNYFAGFDMSSPFFYMSFAVIAIAVIECRTRYINERKNLLPQEESAPAAVGFGHKAAVEKNSADKTLIEAKIRDSQDKTLVGVKFSGSADVAQEKRAADVTEEIRVKEDALPAQTGALVSKTEAPVKKATAVSETKTAVRKTRAGAAGKAKTKSEK